MELERAGRLGTTRAVDDDVLLVEQHLADDDRLVDHGGGNTVCREEIDHVEDVGL
jgi:hypothetical protein